ncbi:MMPL family transporter [Cellulomonas endophytica]|uniref:MMPL family transporter n=1 Tax=Cellulomonas endophytica TaxID=2494735 RepID=UPI00196B0368|nr:MMPL family transporter [Cellulomonas endophytica]
MADLLYRIGRACGGHPWRVVVVWTLVLAAAVSGYLVAGGTLASTLSIPGTPTAEVTERLQRELPSTSGGTGSLVLRSADGTPLDDAQRAGVGDALADAAEVAGVAAVVDPFVTQEQRAEQEARLDDGEAELRDGRAQVEAGRGQVAAARAQLDAGAAAGADPATLEAARAQLDAQSAELDAAERQLEGGAAALADGRTLLDLAEGIRTVSPDGATAVATIVFDEPLLAVTPETKGAVVEAVAGADLPGVQVEPSADLSGGVPSLGGVSEVVGLAVAVLVLVVMLGTLVAAALPLLTALVGVGVAATATLSFSGAVEMSSVTPVLGLMLGLAVGIDYSLFILNRHRRQLRRHVPVLESIGLANGTSGNAVVFAGSTVVIALVALNLTGIGFLGLMGTAAAVAVAVAVLVAVTLTPALLALAGPRALPRRQRTSEPAPAPPARAMSTPWAVLRVVLCVVALLVLAVPAASMRLGLPDGSQEAEDTSAYRAYAALAEGFGEGANGPLLVVADVPDGATGDTLVATQARLATAIAGTPDVVAVAPAGSDAAGTVLAFQVVPAEGPTSESTADLVHALRALTPAEDPDVRLSVAGAASANIDISEKLADALPLYLVVVVGLSLLILVMVFRSLLVPVLATGGFLLSLLATFGGVTAVYQWGWLGDLFGVHDPGPVLSFLPTILIGVLFGLAMDYQLFLTSGMREAYAHGAPARLAVTEGVRAGRAVVTAAAIIMVSVFSGFVFSHVAAVRPMGFALAFGVLVDAFVVRMTLVPALMHLLGERAWWLPRGLARVLPDVDVEGAALERHHPVAAVASAPSAAAPGIAGGPAVPAVPAAAGPDAAPGAPSTALPEPTPGAGTTAGRHAAPPSDGARGRPDGPDGRDGTHGTGGPDGRDGTGATAGRRARRQAGRPAGRHAAPSLDEGRTEV